MKYLKLYEDVKDLSKVIDLLERDCKPFIDLISKNGVYGVLGGLLYRGTYSNEDVIEKRKVLRDRKPRDLSDYLHVKFDKAFEKKFGNKLRSESLFVYKEGGNPGEYGVIYLVFPIGEFKYYWSPEVDDLYSFMDSEVDMTFDTFDVDNIITSLVTTYKDDSYNLISDNEIMILCDEYYLVDVRFKDDIVKHLSTR